MHDYLKIGCLIAMAATAFFCMGCDADNGQLLPAMKVAAATAEPAAASENPPAPPENAPAAPQPETAAPAAPPQTPPPPAQPNTENPQTFQDYMAKAAMLIHAAKYDEAIPALEKAKELDPKNSFPYIGLCAVYMAKDKDEEAYAAIKKAFEMSPEVEKAFGTLMKNIYETKDADAIWAEVEALKAKGVFLNPVMMEKVKRVTGRDQAAPPAPPADTPPAAAAPAPATDTPAPAATPAPAPAP